MFDPKMQTSKISHPVTLAIGYFRGKNWTPVITNTVRTTLTLDTSSHNAPRATDTITEDQMNSMSTSSKSTAKKSLMNYVQENIGMTTNEQI